MRIELALLFILPAACTAEADRLRVGRADADTAVMLAGMTPGQPAACITLRDIRDTTLSRDGETILFEGRGNLVHVTRPTGGCSGTAMDYLQTRSTTGRLCDGDLVRVFGTDGIERGTCSVRMFTPYRRAG